MRAESARFDAVTRSLVAAGLRNDDLIVDVGVPRFARGHRAEYLHNMVLFLRTFPDKQWQLEHE